MPLPPLPRVGIVESTTSNSSDWAARTGQVVSLLEQHGAREDVINFREIRVAREDSSYVIFVRGTNNWNRFTLFELLAATYLKLPPPTALGEPHKAQVFKQELQQRYQGYHRFSFPKLRDLLIRRALPNGERREIRPNMENLALEWGDVILIPEGPHVVGEEWKGLDAADQEKVLEKIRRKVTVTIGGRPTELLLERGPFGLRSLLETEAKLLTSSDPERIRVHRSSPDGALTIPVNLTTMGDEPDVWLQDGDQVVVPDTKPNP